ncbi:MAG: hypothetical protein LBD11_08600 [Candidatus Peribacteria bacterium]|nr:hypothetical protein [Candidatus Peribacteria bacterium]
MSYPNFSGRVVKMELSMENQASSVVFGLKITDITTSQVLYSNSRTDTNVQALTGAGQWGVANHMFGTGRDIPILKVSNYNLIRTYSLKSNTKNITFGDTIMYTITAPETTVVSLSADKGGTFSPTNIELNEGNDYTATVDYTPTVPGLATITADFSTATSLTGEVFVRPYTTIIGFIGDSITA